MKALTLWQPWASLVACGAKLVENRTWKPAPKLIYPGERFAIHAGRTFGVGEWEALLDVCRERRIVLPPRERMPFSAIIATARFTGWTDRAEEIAEEQRVWFAGPIGWVLEDVRELVEPVPFSGSRGLWDLPADVEALVRSRERKAVA